MKAGNFNFNDYLEKLYEETEEKEKKEKDEAESDELKKKSKEADEKEEDDDDDEKEEKTPKKSNAPPKSGESKSSAPKAAGASTDFMDGGEGTINADGIVIPQENKKSYDWLKKEFQKGKVEVKVEMNMGGAKFEPGYDLQTDLKSVKDFKPGMFGEVKTADNASASQVKSQSAGSNSTPKQNLDPKKQADNFGKTEGAPQKNAQPKTNAPAGNINNKPTAPGKPAAKPAVAGKPAEKPEDEEKSGVKKIDLKTKKK